MAIVHHPYQPIQPSTSGNSLGILYRELKPDARLHSLIYCYWDLKTTRPLHEPFTYRVAADGCTDIFFERSSPQQSAVMGISTKKVLFTIGDVFHYTGIRFLPAAFPLLFRHNASDLTNLTEPLDSISPALSAFIASRAAPSCSREQLKNLFDHFFLSSFDTTAPGGVAPGLFMALETILKTRGTIKIEKELSPGLSPRQLRRLFNRYVGTTPKSFSRVVRFQHTLNNLFSEKNQFENASQPETAYYDQAHCIREFKTFYGTTPAKISAMNLQSVE